MGSVPVDVQCPLTSSLGEFLGYWAGSGIHCLSLRLPYLGVFPFTLHLPLDFICVFPLRPTYLHPFGRPFTYRTHSLGEFQAWDWLWNPVLWSQKRQRVCMVLKSRSKFLPWPGENLEPWN